MKNHAVLEALLRPPIELWSVAMAWGVALVAVVAPWALMMPPLLGWVAAVIAFAFGYQRLRQALQILRYQHYMKYYKVTRISPSKIPVGKDEYYLGEGFEWTQLHTQRKRDATRTEAEPFVKPSATEVAMRRWGTKLNEDMQAKLRRNPSEPTLLVRALAGALASEAWFNPLRSYPDLGGSPILHGVGALQEGPVKMRQSSRSGHMIVMGTTRVGKTRMLEMFATQDIHAGHVTIVIDPKGDAELMLRLYAEAARAGRLDQFYLFHLGYPEISARYNGIGNFARITEVATRATNALPSSGNSAAFKEFSWRFTNIVAQAQVALGRVPTYETLLKDVTGIDGLFMDYARMIFTRLAQQGQHTDWEKRVAALEAVVGTKGGPAVPRSLADRTPDLVAMFLWIRDSKVEDTVLRGLAAAFSYERSFYEKIIASLGPFLEKLTTGAVGKLISPDYFDASDKRPVFDWMTVMRQGGIVYVGLDALSDSVVSSAVGNSMLADLVSVGGKLYKTGLDPHHPDGKLQLPTVCCHFDEVNEIAGPEFVPMVNKLGGSGFRITAYTQSMFDIEARVGDKAKAGQILDNFNHLVMLRVRSVTTANLLAEQVPQVEVVHLTPMSGVTDTAAQGTGVDFTSRNDDIVTTTKVAMIEAADLLSLPQGQAFALLEGNRRFKIRIPLADSTNDPFVPESLKKVASDMRNRYRTSEQWAKETDWMGDWMAAQPLGAAAADLIATDLSQEDAGAHDHEGGIQETAANEAAMTSTALGQIMRHGS
ncbi:type IV conjugative transfer system coupling protein TraD [Paracidovorax valerianellae]|uniref:Conjugative coupling factor TraD, TOL family n=1 Tax=Paracidovorax valerianellae TaxID=187868 RepID=A0A1G7EI71_9BURK|nr:type IV conjugative transfer system coupling protein TraD [Paracidovorax valerianellae]MDA8446367.1 type IV conjugative transfer system coupling protein TraD [Paracidovorax valerianellae]SDE63338.1 conjugative coupling factor TraD, TOL family [Paracidovorax valerianellae]